MMRTFRVPLPVKQQHGAIFTDGEVSEFHDETFKDIEIEAIPQEENLMRAWNRFRLDRYGPEGYWVLGWRTWLQLGWEISQSRGHDPDRTFQPREYRGTPIVVLEHVADHLSVAPMAGRNVQIGKPDTDEQDVNWRAAFGELKDLTIAVGRHDQVPDIEVDIASIVKAHLMVQR